MKTMLLTSLMVVVLSATNALATNGCALAIPGDHCSEDNYGNVTHTEQNISGGYDTYRNNILESHTSQNLNGGWDQKNSNGTVNTYNNNPYGVTREKTTTLGN